MKNVGMLVFAYPTYQAPGKRLLHKDKQFRSPHAVCIIEYRCICHICKDIIPAIREYEPMDIIHPT